MRLLAPLALLTLSACTQCACLDSDLFEDDTAEDTADDTGSDDSGVASNEVPRTSRMHAFLADADAAMHDLDPAAELFVIVAVGIDDDGRIALDGETGFERRWSFGYTTPGGHTSQVIYMSESWTASYPDVVADSALDPKPTITNPAGLPDSHTLVDRFSSASGCPGVSGQTQDVMTIRNDPDLGGDLLQFTTSGANWGAAISGSEFDPC